MEATISLSSMIGVVIDSDDDEDYDEDDDDEDYDDDDGILRTSQQLKAQRFKNFPQKFF